MSAGWSMSRPNAPGTLPRVYRLREATPADAADLLALKRKLDQETSFMLLEDGERTETTDDIAAELKHVADAPNRVVIIAESERELVGYAQAAGGTFQRDRATAHVVIGVLEVASGQGVGSRLMTDLTSWASARGVHRLELTVMAHNRRARELYERLGYTVEGRRRECLRIDGRFVDELYMARLLPTAT